MSTTIARTAVVVALLLSASVVLPLQAQEPPAPVAPAGTTAPVEAQAPAVDVATLIQEGVRLYDQGSYEAAVKKYTQALELEPQNLTALYERAMALLHLGQYELCMADIEKGLGNKGPTQAGFYMLAGTCHSTQNQLDKALQYYEEGLKAFPKDEGLHFNLAILLNKMDRKKEAREEFKEVLKINPERESANLNLGLLFEEAGYKMPALFLYLRFLWAEPSTTRSKEATGRIEALIGQGVTATDANNITLDWNASAPTDEGDFSALDLFLTLSQAVAIGDEAKPKTRAEQSVDSITSLVEVASELKDRKRKKTFVWKHAISFLVEMQGDNVLEPFLYRELALAGEAGAQPWLDTHRDDLARLDQWAADAEAMKKD